MPERRVVAIQNADPSNSSHLGTFNNGTGLYSGDSGQAELDPLGSNVGTSNPFASGNLAAAPGSGGGWGDPFGSFSCRIDGFEAPCSLAMRMLGNGSGGIDWGSSNHYTLGSLGIFRRPVYGYRDLNVPDGPDDDDTIRVNNVDERYLMGWEDVSAGGWSNFFDSPEAEVQSAIDEASKILQTDKCKNAIEGLLKKAFLEVYKDDLKSNSPEEALEMEKGIAEAFGAKAIISSVKDATKIYLPKNLNLDSKSGHTSATVTRPDLKTTITFFAGFFTVINNGKTGFVSNGQESKAYKAEARGLQDRAFTVIHEGIHTLSPFFSDGFIGRIIKDKKENLTLEDGSKAISDFIEKNCK